MSKKHEYVEVHDCNELDNIAVDNAILHIPVISTSCQPLLVVGLGVSEGGLAAIKTVFNGVHADSGMAFVLVQQPRPHTESSLATLVADWTAMQVLVAADGMAVQGNAVYVIPPDAVLTIEAGVLHVASPAKAPERRTPFTIFLISLAIDQRENAVGIILPGFGSDGADGIAAIKEHGGLTLRQAAYDRHAKSGRPQSATVIGLEDDSLPAEEMPAALLNYQQHRSIFAPPLVGKRIATDLPSFLPAICEALNTRTGHDFSLHKIGTLMRRVQRRMQALQVADVPTYIDKLRTLPNEADALFRDLLVSVTGFFRDPDAFAALAQTVLAPLIGKTVTTEPIRIWVAACATGEEAYSIAILLLELMESTGHHHPVQIFATDIDDRAISVARAGRYSTSIANVVSQARLDRYFTKDHDRYQVCKAVREICVFSVHNIIKDPPFSRLDVITCRNLLIYLQPSLQEHVFTLFHYALRQNGHLMLGQVESVPTQSLLFATADKHSSIFTRRNAAARFPTFLLAAPHEQRRASLARPTDGLPEAVGATLAIATLPPTPPDPAPAADDLSGQAKFEKLLLLTQERLRAVSDELEAANHELETSQQEYLAVNEELQSANEELETSKSELQSLNEALQTTNAALNQRNDDLMRSSGDLNNLFDSTSIATLFLDSALNIRRFTPQLLDIFNLRDGDEGRPISDIVTSLTHANLTKDVQLVLSTRKSVEREVTAVSGVTYLMQVRPYRELNNAVNGAVLTFVDISARKQHEYARSHLAAIVESSQDGIISHELSGIITSWNAGAELLFGFTATEAIGQMISNLLHDPQPERAQINSARLTNNQPVARYETELMTKSGHALEVSITISPVREDDGRIVGASVVARDISERKAADRKAELLLGELDHRVKNTLAVVSAVVSQTLASGLSPEAFSVEIEGRIRAVAKAHSLLTNAGSGTLSLRDVIETELAPYDRNPGNIVVSGPDVDMTPKAGLALAMAIHELTSNAAKYGALSTQQGHLAVISSLSSGPNGITLHLDWTEAQGPTVFAPTRRGFGTSLIERALAYELDAKVTRSFAASGMVCEVLIPLTEEVGHVQPCPVS